MGWQTRFFESRCPDVNLGGRGYFHCQIFGEEEGGGRGEGRDRRVSQPERMSWDHSFKEIQF